MTALDGRTTDPKASPAGEESFFTVMVEGEIFGLSVQNVQTIFRISSVTPIPLGPPDIAGLVNLRGRIVTAVSLRRRLKMSAGTAIRNAFAVGIEHNGESFALIVDEVGDVVSLPRSMQTPLPPHFDPARARLTSALYRMGTQLVPVLDVPVLLDFSG